MIVMVIVAMLLDFMHLQLFHWVKVPVLVIMLLFFGVEKSLSIHVDNKKTNLNSWKKSISWIRWYCDNSRDEHSIKFFESEKDILFKYTLEEKYVNGVKYISSNRKIQK